jgi:hypothetical protein
MLALMAKKQKDLIFSEETTVFQYTACTALCAIMQPGAQASAVLHA